MIDLNVDKVVAVLLVDGIWHKVFNFSFKVGTISFNENGKKMLPVTGFTFQSDVGRISGPITSVQAVREK